MKDKSGDGLVKQDCSGSNELLLKEFLARYGIGYHNYLVKKLVELNFHIIETNQKYMILESDTEKFEEMINDHFSVKDLFYKISKKHNFNEEVLTSFLLFAKHITMSKKMFFLKKDETDIYYLHNSSINAIKEDIVDWLSIQGNPDNIPEDCMDINKAAQLFDFNPFQFLKTLKRNPNLYNKEGIHYFPKSYEMKKWGNILADMIPFRPFLKEVCKTSIEKGQRNMIYNKLYAAIKEEGYLIDGSYLPIYDQNQTYINRCLEDDIREFVSLKIEQFKMLSLKDVANKLDIMMPTLLMHIERGQIESSDKKYIKQDEFQRLLDLRNSFVGLVGFFDDLIRNQETTFSFVYAGCRNDFYEYLERNDWYSLDLKKATEVFYYEDPREVYYCRRSDLNKLEIGRIMLWFKAYKTSNEERLNLLDDHFKGKFPQTCKTYIKFVYSNNIQKDKASWLLFSHFIEYLNCDICDYESNEFERLIKEIFDGLTNKLKIMFSEYLISMKTQMNIPITEVYSAKIPDRGSKTLPAYSYKDFMIMAWHVFNEDSIKSNNLISKALSSKDMADLWLYIAIHFICGWRSKDILSIQLPEIIIPKTKIMELLNNGDTQYSEFARFAEELFLKTDLIPQKPSKTSSAYYAPTRRLHIPESIKGLFGLMICIASSHHLNKKYDRFIKGVCKATLISEFFGKDFSKSIGNVNFSTIRANKSFEQGLELVSDMEMEYGKPQGYLIAAIARGHMFGYGTLPETTDIYLRDGNYSGYKPEFILFQMFERGVCSFAATLLLEIYAKGDLEKLPIVKQTELIQVVGLLPNEIENIANALEIAQNRSKAVVRNLLRDMHLHDNERELCKVLQKIASGKAVAKSESLLCLLNAVGKNCCYDEKEPCNGCEYAILTNAIAYQLGREYTRLLDKMKSVNRNDEKERHKKILKEAIMPLIIELTVHLKKQNNSRQYEFITDLLTIGENAKT